MPAPAYQSKSSTGESYTDTFAPSVPSGTASGDLLLACCWMASYEIDTAPGGWTQALSISNASGTYLNVFWKIAGASESTPTFTAAGASYGEVILYRLTGADGSTPIDVTATDTGTLNAPSVTTTGADRFVLHLFGSSTSSGSSIAVPSGDTQLDAPSNFYIGLSSGYTSQATAGATGAAAFDDGTMTSDQITATLAIAPPTAASNTPTYVGGAAATTGLASSIQVASSTIGASAGDTLVAVLRLTADRPLTIPAGWSVRTDSADAFPTRILTRRVTASEPTNHTFSWSGGDAHAALAIVAYSGDFDVAAWAAGATTAATSVDSPSVTTSVNDARVVVFETGGYDGSGTPTVTVPSGATTRVETSLTGACLASVADFELSTAGATGAQSWTVANINHSRMATVALIPTPDTSAAPQVETSASTGFQSDTTSLAPATPSGTEPGDLLIAVCWGDVSSGVFSAASGWSRINSSGSLGSFHAFARIATASEPAYSFTHSSGTFDGAANVYRISNAYQAPGGDPLAAIDIHGTSGGAVAPSVTTTVDDCLLLHLTRDLYTTSGDGPAVATPTDDQLANETIYNGSGTVWAGWTLAASRDYRGTAGSTGTASFTLPDGTGNGVMTIAIRPRETPTLSSAATLPTDLTAHWDDSASSSVGSNTLTQSNAANGTLTFGGGAKVGDYHLRTTQTGGESGLYYLKNGTALALQAPFTVGLWTKINAGGANAKTLLTLTGTDVDDITVTQPGGSGTQTATLQVGGVSLGTDSTALESWAFVAVRADGNGQLAMRLNGGSWQSGVHDAGQTYDELRVGQITTDGMDWSIDAISVFDRSLSDDEVDILYATGDGNQYPWRQLPQLTVEIAPQSLQPDVTDTTLPQLTVEIVPQTLQPTSVVTTLPQLTVEIVPQPLAGTLVSTALPQLTVEVVPQPLQPTAIVATLPQLTVEIVPQTLQPTAIVATLPQLTVEVVPQQLQPTPIVTVLPQLTVEIVPVELPTPALPQLTVEIVPQPLQPTPIVTTLPQLTVEIVPQPLQPDVTDTTLPQLTVEIVPQTLQPTPIVTRLPQLTVEIVPQPLQPDVTDTTLPQLTVEIMPLPLSGTPVSTTLPQLTVEIIPQTLQPTPIVTTLPQLTVAIVPLPPDITPTPIDATGLKLLNLANPGPLIVLPMITQDTGVAIGRLVDQDLAQFPLSGLHMALLTVWDQQSQELIRGSHNVLNAGTVAIAETEYSSDDITRLTWSIETRDTELVDITVAQGRETHRAVFEFAWNAERITTLVSPFAVTSGSPLVTVTAPSHGLEVKDSVAIVGSSAVGGLSLDGVHLVRSRIDDDTFTIEHRPRLSTITTDASATATGGGTPQLLIRPRKATHELKLQLSAADVT